jgi:hypothetical protein
MCDGIESVPYHKVFSFGGKKGMMQYMNTVEVMDCGSQVGTGGRGLEGGGQAGVGAGASRDVKAEQAA